MGHIFQSFQRESTFCFSLDTDQHGAAGARKERRGKLDKLKIVIIITSIDLALENVSRYKTGFSPASGLGVRGERSTVCT